MDGVHWSFGLDADRCRGDVSHRDSWVRAQSYLSTCRVRFLDTQRASSPRPYHNQRVVYLMFQR